MDKAGKHLYEVIAPEDAERRIGKQLEEQERRARENRTLSFGPVRDGTATVFMRLDVQTLALLRALLDPLARTRPTGPDGPDLRTSERRLADAFAELLGLAGHPLSATAVRQLACDAEIVPAVLGSDGAVLDLGTATRLFTYAQRLYLGLRDGHHCSFPTCRRPEQWTEAHHIRHWVDGGKTDVGNGVLLCQYHHTTIHTKGWIVRMGDHGHPEYIPPPWIDPYQAVIRPDDLTTIRR
ncbi:HNH endonuclease signature motif containing protein [Actinopolymorpha pittospori]|uniref:HNH endonuclease signature motif containing protein n=1 Tax=Actinopolymorpha pittospori TaxID=648752 RepID=UPI0023532FEA|nr:HNH endonuclease signature motif containing protein [Actinopolymorpha pittospori]